MTSTAHLRTIIANELNRRPDEIIGSPSLSVGLVINREINSALKHYESMRTTWSERKDVVLRETVSGTRYYSLSTSLVRYVKIDSVKLEYNNSYITLNPISWGEMEEKDRQIDGSLGIPQDYVIYNSQMRMYPVPNQSMTILLAYLERPLLTSLTGSFTGTGSSTPTSTASHHNRIGGWYEHGAALIKERAVASIRISYLRDSIAKQEQGVMKQRGLDFLSGREHDAYNALRDETNDQIATGRIRPYYI